VLRQVRLELCLRGHGLCLLGLDAGGQCGDRCRLCRRRRDGGGGGGGGGGWRAAAGAAAAGAARTVRAWDAGSAVGVGGERRLGGAILPFLLL
jgi:hypothetical protein